MPLPADKEVSFKESVNLSCDLAMATLDIPEGMAKYIRNVNNVYQVRFPVKIKGQVETFIGWRAVHSDHKLHFRGAPVLPGGSGRLSLNFLNLLFDC